MRPARSAAFRRNCRQLATQECSDRPKCRSVAAFEQLVAIKRKRAQVGHDLLRLNIISPQFYPSTQVEKRFPGTCVPRYLCFPVFPGPYVPRYLVPRPLCSSVPMTSHGITTITSHQISRSSSLSLHEQSSASAIFYNSLLSSPWLPLQRFRDFSCPLNFRNVRSLPNYLQPGVGGRKHARVALRRAATSCDGSQE